MHTRSQSQRLAVAVSLLTVWIVWGSSYLAIAIAIETIPPFAMASVRFVAAGVLMLLVARARAVAWPRLRQWGAATVVGTLLLVGGNGLVTWAQLSVPSSIAALLITTVPLWMAVLDSVLYRGGRMRVRTGVGLAVFALGSMVPVAQEASDILTKKGLNATVVNARFAKPLDEKTLHQVAKDHQVIVTLEEGTICGGFGSAVAENLRSAKIKTPVHMIGIPDRFIEHGSREELLDDVGLSPKEVAEKILRVYGEMSN